jgi:hypothetical protein
MQAAKVLIYCAGFLLAGCHFKEREKPVVPKKINTEKITVHREPVTPQSQPYLGQYCFVKREYSSGDSNYIEADYIQFLMGKEAIDAATKRGEEEVVLDDYYIVNENTKLRILPVSKDVVIQLVTTDSGKSFYENTDQSALSKRLKDGIFVLQINNGLVTKIKQQFLP